MWKAFTALILEVRGVTKETRLIDHGTCEFIVNPSRLQETVSTYNLKWL
jgi:hypothetical protein